MFRREVKSISDLLNKYLRVEGLEVPLQQKRIIDSWETVVGKMVASYTREKFIKNQIVNPALRQDLTMMRAQLVKRLNAQVGGMVIADIRIY